MKIIFLSDNRSCDDSLHTEHGLSLYVETEHHRILLDTGASDLFIDNAVKQGVDLSLVDYVFISHGHSDHIGGLPHFIKINHKARIILASSVMGGSYVSLRNHRHSITTEVDFNAIKDRLILVDKNICIDNEISVIADIPYREEMPVGNCNLYRNDTEGNLIRDDFNHELLCRVGNLLFTGCAHHGILNIMSAVNFTPTYVIGGFHLLDDYETEANLKHIAGVLTKEYPSTKFFTGHCTGDKCYAFLKAHMGDKINNFCLGYHIDDIRFQEQADYDGDTVCAVKNLVRQLSNTCDIPSDEYISNIIKSPFSKLFTVKANDKVVGMALLCKCLMPTGTKYWIEDVVIDADYRNRHIGSDLINYMLSTLPEKSKVLLTSRPARAAANKMYQTLGFKKRETNVYKKEI